MSSKETILDALSKQTFVSGQKLAGQCGISRNAVNKTIKRLRAEGFLIDAVNNKGYLLKSGPDRLDADAIQRILSSHSHSNVKILLYNTLDSTISEAKRLIADISSFRDENQELTEEGAELHPTLILSEKQTSGRGRMGRVFVSPENSGIYLSLVYAPKNGVQNPAVLTAAAAVAVADAVETLYGGECKIKWVNDVFLHGKKISGILTEGAANFETGKIQAAVVGIGVNVRNGHFDEELKKTAGSIEDIIKEYSETGKFVSRNELAAQITSNLLDIYDSFFEENDSASMKSVIEKYRSRSLLTGLEVTVNPVAGLDGNPYTARVKGISDDARLIVALGDGTEKYLDSGEVSLKSSSFSN